MTPLADGGHDHGAATWASVSSTVPLLALLVAGYAYAATSAGQPAGSTSTRSVISWYAGLGVVAAALYSPLAGSHAVSAHMLQHELLLTIAPLLLVAGLDRRIALPLHRTVVAPVFATALWVAVVLGWHLPPVYEASLDGGGLHLARHASLVAAGVVFWIVVVGRLPSVRVQQRIAALGVAMAAGGVLGAVLVWSDTVLYPGHGGDAWLDPLQDQRLAGAVMMAIDMPVLLGALGWVVAQWARQQPSVPARGAA